LQTVASQAGVSLAALMVYNSITNPADVHEGQTIKIPDPNSADAHPAEVHHVVRPGENMTTIARLYGVTPEAISARNGITDPNHIFAGQELIVPLK
jgi:LysM repeat protein